MFSVFFNRKTAILREKKKGKQNKKPKPQPFTFCEIPENHLIKSGI